MIHSEIIEIIQKLSTPAIVGISGFGGSGKSTFAKIISSEMDASVISVDSFCQSIEKADYRLWEIFDFERMEREVFKPFLSGETEILYGEFDWVNNDVTSSTIIRDKKMILVEGVGLFRPGLLKYFSLTIWIECPIEVAVARGKKRDRETYGVTENGNWDGLWKDNDLQYYQEFSPMENADFILKYTK